MEFIATESGFEHGLGGASNATSEADYHYVLFGEQSDEQHPKNSGVYFEFDDQIHGSVNSVTGVVVLDDAVRFELKDLITIVVRRGMGEQQWNEFLKGVRDTFSADIIQDA
jgi:hypothetical protein